MRAYLVYDGGPGGYNIICRKIPGAESPQSEGCASGRLTRSSQPSNQGAEERSESEGIDAAAPTSAAANTAATACAGRCAVIHNLHIRVVLRPARHRTIHLVGVLSGSSLDDRSRAIGGNTARPAVTRSPAGCEAVCGGHTRPCQSYRHASRHGRGACPDLNRDKAGAV